MTSRLAQRRADRLAAALGLAVGVCLIAGGVMPAYAVEPPPEMPHQFYGAVSRDGAPVAEGTLVQAFVGGVKQAETIVDSQSRYGYDSIFRVPGTTGAIVTFKVGGVLADETATWQSGAVQQLNLTIHEQTPPPVQYELTVSSTAGGSVSIPGEGVFKYYAGAVVHLLAEAESGYGFVSWSASAGTFSDASAADTYFTMPSQDVSVTAHFGIAYNLAMAADPVSGGNATDVAGKGAYPAGVQVRIRAVASAGYRFANWTAPAGAFANITAADTTFTMPPQPVTVTAHFGLAYDLAMAAHPANGGNAIDLTNASPYLAGTVVTIRAVAAAGYQFANWTAPAGVFNNPTAAETTFITPAENVTVTACFEEAPPPPAGPTVTTEAATDITSYSGIVHMSYTVGNLSSVEVRFACKRLTDPSWFYTTWVPRTADGNYTEVLAGLVSETDYEFKAQLRYDSTVIEGSTRQFTTSRGASRNFRDLIDYFGCFIATAAYGSPTAEQIGVLREFRDVVLLRNALGCQFVGLYYRLSPPIANVIARNELLRAVVRGLLIDPIVWVVRTTGGMWRN
ncbi:MAG: InlB B-repeat-containing protein [Dehalococcoidia bacterium]